MQDAAIPENAAFPRILVAIPTYNEIENLGITLSGLHASMPNASVIVVDDGSPDGTGVLADRLARSDARISVIHRSGKSGLGSAYLAAFDWGISRGYDVLVEMDADGSHPADVLPQMIQALGDLTSPTDPGLVIGSRWIEGGDVVNWPRSREVLSRGGNFYARLALGISVHDATAGYRAYRASLLKQIPFEKVDSFGYCFQIDLTLRTLGLGYRIVEVPITFRERERGESKMSKAIVFEAMAKVTVWGFARRWRSLRQLLSCTPFSHRPN
jgi:dolichol-phosphate mannosyltransferase